MHTYYHVYIYIYTLYIHIHIIPPIEIAMQHPKKKKVPGLCRPRLSTSPPASLLGRLQDHLTRKSWAKRTGNFRSLWRLNDVDWQGQSMIIQKKTKIVVASFGDFPFTYYRKKKQHLIQLPIRELMGI